MTKEHFKNSKHVRLLGPSDFEEKKAHEIKNKKLGAVLFFAPWCPHCVVFAPTWEDIAKQVPYFNMMAYNCADKKNAGHMDKMETDRPNLLKGYPTIMFYKNGKPIDDYHGERSHEKVLSKIMDFTREHGGK